MFSREATRMSGRTWRMQSLLQARSGSGRLPRLPERACEVLFHGRFAVW